MTVIHPKAFTHVIVELLSPIRRGKRSYMAGYQLAVQGPLGETLVSAVDMDGVALVVRGDLLEVVSTPKTTVRPEPRPTVDLLLARGVVRRASQLN